MQTGLQESSPTAGLAGLALKPLVSKNTICIMNINASINYSSYLLLLLQHNTKTFRPKDSIAKWTPALPLEEYRQVPNGSPRGN